MTVRILATACLCACAMAAGIEAVAQSYPARSIRLVIGYAPGGTGDAVGRPVAQKMSELLGQTVVVENRGGAGGVAGAANVAQSAPDGYSLLLSSTGAFTISMHLTRLPYDPINDFTPITQLVVNQFVLCLHPSLPATSVRQLIALAKARKVEFTYGSAGTGGVSHLSGELFSSMTGVRLVHVPYRGSGPMTVDLLAGQVDMAFPAIASLVPVIKAGRVRALAVTGARRSFALPELPTMEEAGVAAYEASAFWGLVGPAKLPRDIVMKINAAAHEALKARDLREAWIVQGNEPVSNTPEQFAAMMKAEAAKWGKILRAAGIRGENS